MTLLSVYGAQPRVAQKLARHTDLKLTMGVYTDAGLLAGWEAVEALPDLCEPAANVRGTATKEAGSGPNPVAPDVALECVAEGLEASSPVTEAFRRTA